MEKIIASGDNRLFEEDSYFFLQEYQFLKNWWVYDSDTSGMSYVKTLLDTFVSFHGKILFSRKVTQHFAADQILPDYWSIIPLGTFGYKMVLNNGAQGFYLIDSVKIVEGYIVEGAYWANGFFYSVRDNKEVIQVKLFVDDFTKVNYCYPDII